MSGRYRLRHMPGHGWWRTTRADPALYTNLGTLLLWLALPVSTLDQLIAPDFFAPHPECDGVAEPVLGLVLGALPWAAVSFLAVAMVSVPATQDRQGGADIFDFTLGYPPWDWLLTLPVIALIAYVGVHMWEVAWWLGSEHVVTADCQGEARPVAVTVRAPPVQFMPLLEVALCLWLLHIRALALSPRRRCGA